MNSSSKSTHFLSCRVAQKQRKSAATCWAFSLVDIRTKAESRMNVKKHRGWKKSEPCHFHTKQIFEFQWLIELLIPAVALSHFQKQWTVCWWWRRRRMDVMEWNWINGKLRFEIYNFFLCLRYCWRVAVTVIIVVDGDVYSNSMNLIGRWSRDSLGWKISTLMVVKDKNAIIHNSTFNNKENPS